MFDVRAVLRQCHREITIPEMPPLLRPDQHIAEVLPLDARDELAAFLDAFMTS